jgi:hypothetical protein
MSNMSYCRFENTLSDLNDCYENIHDVLQGSEKTARQRLIELCQRIVDEECSVDENTGRITVEEYEDDQD